MRRRGTSDPRSRGPHNHGQADVVGAKAQMAWRLSSAGPSRLFSTCSAQRSLPSGERLILGIETSCDDTCASLVAASPGYTARALLAQRGELRGGGHDTVAARLVNSIVHRQDHGERKGIEPLVAQHYHMTALPQVIAKCLRQGGVSSDGKEIDAIAVTQGPGMPGCLGVGLTAAKTLAAVWDKPLIPVHHMEAHALTPFLTQADSNGDGQETRLAFPFLTLLVSGGHTMLVLARGVGRYKILVNCSDDSIGDAFDKTARVLGLVTDWTKESPGATLEAFAAEYVKSTVHEAINEGHTARGIPEIPEYSHPFAGRPEFSYSGLKSAVRRHIDQLAAEAMGVEVPPRPPPPPSLTSGQRTRPPRPKPNSSKGKGEPGAVLPLLVRQKWAAAFQKAAFDHIIEKVELVIAASTARLPSSRCCQGDDNSDQRRQSSAKGKASVAKEESRIPREWRSGTKDDAEIQALLEDIREARHLVVSGGVASNAELRKRLAQCWRRDQGRHLLFPPIELCVDNAAMIAHVGALLYEDAVVQHERDPTAAFQALARGRWSLEDLGGQA
ncbi:unnamed protein product [Parajaminaea phylloscopi]